MTTYYFPFETNMTLGFCISLFEILNHKKMFSIMHYGNDPN
jgi:hypothetical protein